MSSDIVPHAGGVVALTVDDDFRSLIPPLTDDEYSRLERSIIAEGVRDPDAVRFRDVVESHGYVIGSGKANSLNAVTSAWSIFKRDEGRLSDILDLTSACWQSRTAGVNSDIISGIDLFLSNHGDEYKPEQFVKKLSNVKPEHLLGDAAFLYKQRRDRAYTKAVCTYACILKQYNANLRNKIKFVEP